MSVATTKPKSEVELLRAQLTTMLPEFRNALPSHIKPEKMQRVILTVCQQTPELLRTDRRSLLAACIKCAADGLIPDGREAALVVFSGKAQYLPMIGGILKRIRNSGEIAGLVANVVYQNDGFVQRPDDFDRPIEHRPPPLGTDRGVAIGAYAMAKLRDGTIMHEVMDLDAIEKVRAVSRAAKSGPWVSWWDRMAEKTVVKRLARWLPTDSDVEEIIRHDDRVSGGAGAGELGLVPEDGATIDGAVEAPDRLDVLEGAIGDKTGANDTPTHEQQPDPELQRAQDYARMIREAATVHEVEQICDTGDIKRQMTKWKYDKLELFDMVDNAAVVRLAELKAAAPCQTA